MPIVLAKSRGILVLSQKAKRILRHAALIGLAVIFPVLYVAAVTLESAGWSAAALALVAVVCVLAALAF